MGIANAFPHSSGIVQRRDRIDMLVNVARRTLYCTSVIRWSGVSGNVMGPGRREEVDFRYGISGGLNGPGEWSELGPGRLWTRLSEEL